MKYFHSLVQITLVCFVLMSCASDSLMSQEDEQQLLNLEKQEIEDIAGNANCSDDAECLFIAFGSKACGGPQSYLIYNTTIDSDLLEAKVSDYNQKESLFNEKWGIVSDCLAVEPPTSVTCIAGSCTAIYN